MDVGVLFGGTLEVVVVHQRHHLRWLRPAVALLLVIRRFALVLIRALAWLVRIVGFLVLGRFEGIELVALLDRPVKLCPAKSAGSRLVLDQRGLRLDHLIRQVPLHVRLRDDFVDDVRARSGLLLVNQFDAFALFLELSDQLTHRELLDRRSFPGRGLRCVFLFAVGRRLESAHIVGVCLSDGLHLCIVQFLLFAERLQFFEHVKVVSALAELSEHVLELLDL